MTAWNTLSPDIFEHHDSRETDWSFESGEKSQTRVKTVLGYNSAEEAAQAAIDDVAGDMPLIIEADIANGLPALTMRSIRSKPLQPNAYEITAVYRSLSVDQDNVNWTFAFQTNGGTQKVTQAISSRKYGTGPDYGGAINVTKDGVEGVEIGIPGLEFSITKTLAKGILNLDYVRMLALNSFRTNIDEWKGFETGSLLFRYAEGSQKSGAETTVNFHFTLSPNLTSLTYGSITDVEKRGHEYLWIDYISEESGGFVIKKPRTVNVHRVYNEFSFDDLGLDD